MKKNSLSCQNHKESAYLSKDEQEQLFNIENINRQFHLDKEIHAVQLRQLLRKSETRMNAWFEQGRNVEALVHGRAWMIDQFILYIWKYCQGQFIQNETDRIAGTPSLLATGGYGRGELHPQSDIDLLVLFEDMSNHPSVPYVEKFVAFLWDMGLKVGSRVSCLQDCATQAENDITILTALMESRLLAGDTMIENRIYQKISPSVMWPLSHYLPARHEEQKRRYAKYNQTSYNLEPDLKHSPGGLRDIHLVQWLTLRFYEGSDLSCLVKKGILLASEYRLLQKSRQFLWHIRWALHMISGHPEEKLLFGYQKVLAERDGFSDTDNSLAIEQFMQGYFRAVTRISTMKDLLVQHFYDDITVSVAEIEITPVNERFQLKNHRLDITHPDVFIKYPPAIMELFVLATHNPAITGIQTSTIRSLRAHLYLVDEGFRNSPEVKSFFIQLLKGPYGLSSTLEKMARYGLLGRYLPEFAHITGQMQYDLFHIHTVDAHTLLLIKFLRSFRYASNKEKFPLAHAAMAYVKSPELLYIAALYHDIAKGRGEDHSELGAKYVSSFCKNHQLAKKDSEMVGWLVKHHLALSMTAQRSDITDPEVLHKFAEFAGSVERLDYLCCLTVADINATNPKLWNGWRATLVGTLYSESRKILLSKQPLPSRKAYLESRKEQALKLLAKQGADIEKAKKWWNKASEDYFIRYGPDAIVWHTLHLLQQKNDTTPFVMARDVGGVYTAGTAIFIYAPHTAESFVAITSALERLNFNIMDAKVMVSGLGFSMNTFVVLEADNSFAPATSLRMRQACESLETLVRQPCSFPVPLPKRRTPRLLRYFSQKPEIRFSEDVSNNRTIIEVFSVDRPGLLAVIVDTFLQYRIQVQHAKILTFGERVEDIFFVTSDNGKSLEDPDTRNRLTRTLEERLTAHTVKDSYTITRYT